MPRRKLAALTTFLLTALLTHPSLAQTANDQGVLVVRGARILPITGPPIAQGVLVIQGGKITAIGEDGKVNIPSGAKTVDATGKVIMPGIVDSHSHIGIMGNPVSADGMLSIQLIPIFASLLQAASPPRTSCPAVAT